MTKKVGRNDPCPCGSGKKYKKCCEERLGPKRKFQASVLSSGMSAGQGLKGKATKISTNFFSRPQQAIEQKDLKGKGTSGPVAKADEGEAKHPPEADKPM